MNRPQVVESPGGAGIEMAVGEMQKTEACSPDERKRKFRKRVLIIVILVAFLAWCVFYFTTKESSGFHIEMNPQIYRELQLPLIGSFTIDETMCVSAIVMGIMLLSALTLRLFALPKFQDRPKGLQNVIELIVQGFSGFSTGTVGKKVGSTLAPYISTIGIYILMGGIIELIGLRAPASDINVTAALALMTFFLIRYFAYREKGIGRLTHFKPYFMAPIILATDIALPLSMACRLFGNMLAALVVMHLIYGAFPLGVPAALSIYFSLFHAALQAYIFLILTLSFIHESLE